MADELVHPGQKVAHVAGSSSFFGRTWKWVVLFFCFVFLMSYLLIFNLSSKVKIFKRRHLAGKTNGICLLAAETPQSLVRISRQGAVR